jgi:hypothetical protein
MAFWLPPPFCKELIESQLIRKNNVPYNLLNRKRFHDVKLLSCCLDVYMCQTVFVIQDIVSHFLLFFNENQPARATGNGLPDISLAADS